MTDRLAILGGMPVRPGGPPEWPGRDSDVAAAVAAAVADGSWGLYDGPHVAKLSDALTAYLEVAHVHAVASGTLAVEIALRALRISPGDRVILAGYDYEPNLLNILRLQAVPVLVDVAAGNWNLDPDRIEAAVSANAKAIIVSHLHGGLVPMRQVRALAERAGIPIVEDAAQAIGATIDGRKAGAWGDIGVFSFGGSKLLSAGRGGALTTSSDKWNQRIRVELRRGVQQWAALSELQAAALLPQIDRLDERHRKREQSVQRLDKLLVDVPGLTRFQNSVDGSPAFYKVGYQFDSESFGLDRDRFAAAVRAEGIALDPGFRALHVGRSPSRYQSVGSLTEAERAHRGAVVLHHPVLLGHDSDIEEVARAIRKVYANAQLLR